MAKKSNNKTRVKKKNKKLFSDERVKIILGVTTIFMAAFLSLAFISYFFTWKVDQSFQFSKVISATEISVENWSGKAGAHFSNLFINKWFGIASFTFPFLLLVIGFRFFKIKIYSIRKAFKITIIGTIILSVFLGYLFGNSNGYLGSGLGGGHGFIIAQWLNSFLGKVGTAFLLSIAVISFIILSFKKSYNWIIKLSAGLFKKDYTEFDDQSSTEYQDESQEDLQSNQQTISEEEIIDPEKEDIELTIEEKHKEEKLNGNFKNYQLEDYDPTLELSSYKLPPLDLLENHGQDTNGEIDKEEIIANKNRIVETLANYKIQLYLLQVLEFQKLKILKTILP